VELATWGRGQPGLSICPDSAANNVRVMVVEVTRRAVCEAIRTRRLLSVRYGTRLRVLEPYVHGKTAEGAEVLLCYQREGETQSGYRSHWRTLHLAKIEDIRVLDVSFPFLRSEYDGQTPEIRTVHCHV
jgi:hypothetical protein